jgi:hypothetical protein
VITLMIDPPPAAAMRGAASWARRRGPFTLTENSLSKYSLVTSMSPIVAGLMPALLTSTSSRPKRS